MQKYRNDINTLLSNRILRHSLFWAGYLISMTYIHGLGIQAGNYLPWFLNYLVELPLLIGLTYMVTYLIIPKFLLNGKYMKTVLFIISVFLFFSYLNILLDKYVIYPNFFYKKEGIGEINILKVFKNAFGLIFPVVIFVSISFIKYNAEKKTLTDKHQQTKLKEELEMVREKIYPAFLRNALDDIYTLPLDRNNVLPEMIIKISDIFHYLFHECKVEKLSLRKEEQAIRTYFGFLKLRYEENFEYDILIQAPLENTLVSPYILFPLTLSLCSFQKAFDDHPGKIFVYLNTFNAALDFSASLVMQREILQIHIQDHWKEEINLARKRLDAMYPGRYGLDLMETERKLQLKLFLDLH